MSERIVWVACWLIAAIGLSLLIHFCGIEGVLVGFGATVIADDVSRKAPR